jgi:16S rRNA (guanine527-N7)-methyltransferase
VLAVLASDPSAPTTVREPDAAVDAHIADSLSALELAPVQSANRIADIGAGAGFPGLALAIALPAATVTLVESVRRKCDFMARVAQAGAVANAEVACTRAEEWAGGRGACDLVTARALAPLDVVAEYAAPLLAPSGALVAWKGRPDTAEDEAGARAAAMLGLELAEVRSVRPFPGARDRNLYVYLKVGSTPNRFPRRPGMARKRRLGE